MGQKDKGGKAPKPTPKSNPQRPTKKEDTTFGDAKKPGQGPKK